jgi:hypothetical protein
LATRESLKSRASRKRSLEQVVPIYTFAEQQADADALRVRLQNSVERLGSYEADSSFSDPRLMASHALNQLDRANYQEQTLLREATQLRLTVSAFSHDGTPENSWPPSNGIHLYGTPDEDSLLRSSIDWDSGTVVSMIP